MRGRERAADLAADLGRLPAASVAGFKLVPRVRTALLDLPNDVSLSNLQESLTNGEMAGPLASVASSDYELRSLADGYSRFVDAADEGRREGRARSARLAWIVPDDRLTEQLELDSLALDSIRELGIGADIGSDYNSWLPWVSLGMINLFRRWRQPRIRTIRRAMFKLCRGPERAFPWEAGYPTWERQLPMQALYMYEPNRLLDGALAAFSHLELTSINDLRCCHPDAVDASKASGRPLFALYRALGRTNV